MKLAVVGAGWAGLAAAVRATEAGHGVTVMDMARQAGGRARTVAVDGLALDNGQHILIGAYRRTLDLMRTVGADPDVLLDRRPLALVGPDGLGLRLPAGPAFLAFGWAVARRRGWSVGDRLALLVTAAGWAAAGFRCSPGTTVQALCARLPPTVRQSLIDPLCVAALNTPAEAASAEVLLRILRDALFGGRGAADLLLPRRPLGSLLPDPSLAWLRRAGADVRLSTRAMALSPATAGWVLDGEHFDAVVVACAAPEAGRLTAGFAPAWAARAKALDYEPIVTVYVQSRGARLPSAMTALQEGPQAPAQFAFDHGAFGGPTDLFAFVVSGAAPWVLAGLDATAAAVLNQARSAFPAGTWPEPPTVLRTIAERRATFRCTPALSRPPAHIGHRLFAAGDYVEGPYPATLEGAVRSGETAAKMAVAV